MAPGITRGSLHLSIAHVGAHVAHPPLHMCWAQGAFWGAPKPFGSVHARPLMQRSPLLALNALPSPREDLSRGSSFFWKKQGELYREDYHFPMS